MKLNKSMVALTLLATVLLMSIGLTAQAQDSMVIKIAVQAPLETAFGAGVRNATELALAELGAPLTEMGVEIQLVEFDDQADPEVGVANAEEIVADAEILAVIGHVNSGVAIPSSEVYDAAGLVLVSPAVTNPMVTDRELLTVNRLAGRDDAVAVVIAEFIVENEMASVFVINDSTTYGTGLAELFGAAAEEGGLMLAGGAVVDSADEFGAAVDAVTAAAPEVVLLIGEADVYGELAAALREAGFEGTFIGGDSLDNPDFAAAAGDAGVGLYYVTTGAPATAFEGAADFITSYTEMFEEDPTPYAAETYDATGIVLAAIMTLMEEEMEVTRETVAAAVRATADYEGITGVITFDANGDPIQANYFVLEVASADPEEWSSNEVVSVTQIASPLAEE